MQEREYIPVVLARLMVEEGTHEIVGYEDYRGEVPRTAVVVKKTQDTNE